MTTHRAGELCPTSGCLGNLIEANLVNKSAYNEVFCAACGHFFPKLPNRRPNKILRSDEGDAVPKEESLLSLHCPHCMKIAVEEMNTDFGFCLHCKHTVSLLKDHFVSSTGATRSKEADGVRYDLIPHRGLRRVAETSHEGANKYAPHNYKKGFNWSVMLNHAMTHIEQWRSGDSSEDHLAHACWNLLALMDYETIHPELNDIPERLCQQSSSPFNPASQPNCKDSKEREQLISSPLPPLSPEEVRKSAQQVAAEWEAFKAQAGL